MKRRVGGTLIATQLLAVWFAIAQTNVPVQTGLGAGSDQSGPVIACSPGVLEFGVVGVKRTKDLLLMVRNVGEGTLTGKASVAAPFSIVGGKTYSLRSGESHSLTVRYSPKAEGTNSQPVVFSGESSVTVVATGSARKPPRAPEKVRLVTPAEAEVADFITRYFSDATSYVLRPLMMEGPFLTICDRALALKLAGEQPRRELAFVVLIYYPNSGNEEAIKLGWVNDLKELGYQRVVFLSGNNRTKTNVNGLRILEYPRSPTAPGGK